MRKLKAIRKITGYLLFLVLALVHQTAASDSNNNSRVDVINISECGVKFNGHELPLNGNINTWKKILGSGFRLIGDENYSNYGLNYDNMGLMLGISDYNKVDMLRIYFMDYEDKAILERVIPEHNDPRVSGPDDYAKGKAPVHRFQGKLLVQGAPLSRGMGIEEILAARKKTVEDYKLTCMGSCSNKPLAYQGKGLPQVYAGVTKHLCDNKAYRIEYHLGANKLLKKADYLNDDQLAADEWQPAIYYFSIREMSADSYENLKLKYTTPFWGNAAWRDNNKVLALIEYQKYIDYMNSIGKEHAIESLVVQRIEQIKKDRAEWEKNNPGRASNGDYKTPKQEISDELYRQKFNEFKARMKEAMKKLESLQ